MVVTTASDVSGPAGCLETDDDRDHRRYDQHRAVRDSGRAVDVKSPLDQVDPDRRGCGQRAERDKPDRQAVALVVGRGACRAGVVSAEEVDAIHTAITGAGATRMAVVMKRSRRGWRTTVSAVPAMSASSGAPAV